jgi:tRNA(Ile)-lysidine synthase
MPLHPFEQRLAVGWPPEQWRELTVLLAVSGGADSVALLRAMAALKNSGAGRLCVAHCNHQLRVEADADEQFVAELCDRLGLHCEIGRRDVAGLAAESKRGLEETARRARYDFLLETAGRRGARFVVTAHTADDQAETILHRIVRGTGVGGLSGMARSRPFGPATLLRPLLAARHDELLAYLDDLGQPFRRDSSNTDRRYTRNRLRHELLPLLKRHYNAGIDEALLRLGRLAGDMQAVVDQWVEEHFARAVVRRSKTDVEMDASVLAGQPRYLLCELLLLVWRRQAWPMQAMSFAHWEQLADMIEAACAHAAADTAPISTPCKKIFPGNVQAEIGDGRFYLTKK